MMSNLIQTMQLTAYKTKLARRSELEIVREGELREWEEMNRERNPPPAELEKEYTMAEANQRLKAIIQKNKTKY